MVDALAYFLVTAIVYTSPLAVVLWFIRGRMSRLAAILLMALAFATATAFSLWRVEWFDVWRHGTPSLSYMVKGYGAPVAIYAAVGGVIGSVIARRRRRGSMTANASAST